MDQMRCVSPSFCDALAPDYPHDHACTSQQGIWGLYREGLACANKAVAVRPTLEPLRKQSLGVHPLCCADC